jgi:hypothetical protein
LVTVHEQFSGGPLLSARMMPPRVARVIPRIRLAADNGGSDQASDQENQGCQQERAGKGKQHFTFSDTKTQVAR